MGHGIDDNWGRASCMIACTMRLLLIGDEEKLARLVRRALVAERSSVDVSHNGRAGMELSRTYEQCNSPESVSNRF